MRNKRTQELTQQRFRTLFVVIGIPLSSMCLTFLLFYILAPIHSFQPASNDIVAKPLRNLLVVNAPTVGPPVRLQIPALNVDTVINPVGLTSSGAMDIGEDPDQVAWYQLGVIPGQVGSAVIAGHYGWQKNGHGGIFNNLNNLKPGDIVSVYDAAAIKTDFTVRESRLYDPSANASGVFKSDDNKPHLNLITCQGTWMNATSSYSDRLVVFTDLK